MKIHLMDDDADIIQLWQRALRNYPAMEIFISRTIAEAMDAVSSETTPADLYLVDGNFGEAKNGIDILEAMGAGQRAHSVFVSNDEGLRAEAIKLGARLSKNKHIWWLKKLVDEFIIHN